MRLKPRGKLAGGLGLMLVALISLSALGSRSVVLLSRASDQIYERGLLPVKEVLSLKSDMSEGRALLNAMLGESVEAKQRELQGQLSALGKRVETGLTRLGQSEAGDSQQAELLRQAVSLWEQYRKLRDEKVIPFIFEGDMDSANSTAEGASQQAASLEEISANLEELSSMTKRNADNARKANTLAKEAHTAAEHGAEEVRALTQRSANAAHESAQMVGLSNQRTEQGVNLSGHVSEALAGILTKTSEVDQLDADVDTASHEQSQGILAITDAVHSMDKITQEAAAKAEENASAAQVLRDQAAKLEDSVSELLKLV